MVIFEAKTDELEPVSYTHLSGLLDGIKVLVGNDADVAALGEIWMGCAQRGHIGIVAPQHLDACLLYTSKKPRVRHIAPARGFAMISEKCSRPAGM